jgi:hypothetical protein
MGCSESSRASQEMEHDGDDRKDEQNVDDERGHMENHETAYPRKEKNNSENEEHGRPPKIDLH